MTPITKQLDEIEARANKATPGPWFNHTYEDGMFSEIKTYTDIGEEHEILMEAHGYVDQDRENFYFVSRARTDIPRLVAALRVAIDELHRQMMKGVTPDGNTIETTECYEAFGKIQKILSGEGEK